MIIAAYCPACAEVRARSRDLQPGQRPTAADFEVIPGQDPPVDNTPATCTKCRADLVFRRVPAADTNGHAVADHTARQVTSKGVTTLFAVEPGEEVRATKELGPDIIVIFTTRRIVKINLNDLAEES